jgi:hypothetical protein
MQLHPLQCDLQRLPAFTCCFSARIWMATRRAKGGAPGNRRRPLEGYGSLWWYTRVTADLCTVELFYTPVGLNYLNPMFWIMLTIRESVTAYCRGSTHGQPNGMRTAILAFLHAATVLFPAVAIALPKPSTHSWETDVPMALITMTNVVVAPVFLLLQFYAQYREHRRQSGHARTLSLLSLSMQVPVVAILAIRLFIRLGMPPWVPRQNYGPYLALWVWDSLRAFYTWGMLAINYAVCVVGYVFLLRLYWSSSQSRTRGELTPLLA